MNYKPGIIYSLRFFAEGEWYPFYVGRTEDAERRFKEHKYNAKNANDASTHVYQFIKKELMSLGIDFEMNELEQYGTEGPTDLEDEHIVRLLVEGHQLKNMKKGDANWLAERQNAADDMKRRGMTSFRKYKERLSYEEQQRKIEEANAKRIAEELAHKAWQEEYKAKQTLQEATRLKNIAYAHQLAEEKRIEREKQKANAQRRSILDDIRLKNGTEQRQRRIQEETQRLQREEEQRQAIKELVNPYHDDNLDVQTYREYAKMMSQYIQMLEMDKPTSHVLPESYARLKFLTDKIKELSND
jgi:hypothetical protein